MQFTLLLVWTWIQEEAVIKLSQLQKFIWESYYTEKGSIWEKLQTPW